MAFIPPTKFLLCTSCKQTNLSLCKAQMDSIFPYRKSSPTPHDNYRSFFLLNYMAWFVCLVRGFLPNFMSNDRVMRWVIETLYFRMLVDWANPGLFSFNLILFKQYFSEIQTRIFEVQG